MSADTRICSCNKAKQFVELMLKYVVDSNWESLEQQFTDDIQGRYAVLVGISFSVVIRVDYVAGPEVEGEICRVEVNHFTSKESLVKDFVTALGFGDETLTVTS